MNTITGLTVVDGIGFKTNGVISVDEDSAAFDDDDDDGTASIEPLPDGVATSLLLFFPDPPFLGDFRSDDLKLPLRGSLTIQDGGTIMLECTPKSHSSPILSLLKHASRLW